MPCYLTSPLLICYPPVCGLHYLVKSSVENLDEKVDALDRTSPPDRRWCLGRLCPPAQDPDHRRRRSQSLAFTLPDHAGRSSEHPSALIPPHAPYSFGAELRSAATKSRGIRRRWCFCPKPPTVITCKTGMGTPRRGVYSGHESRTMLGSLFGFTVTGSHARPAHS